MKHIILLATFITSVFAQKTFPFDTSYWAIQAKAYVLENYNGHDAIYLHQGYASLKNTTFKNGTIEFDLYLTERQAFPGVAFRIVGSDMESFFLRPHLSGKPDANQAVSVFNGITAWQLYFGERYSFQYDYNFTGWTHVRIVINEDKGQVFLDHSKKANLSWKMKHPPRAGAISIGHSFAPMHYANFTINPDATELVDFDAKDAEIIPGVIKQWTISDKFSEALLTSHKDSLRQLINSRKWPFVIAIDDHKAVNISHKVQRYGSPGNTVFAKLNISSDRDQTKLFQFGYSDRVVAILNGRAIYSGTNKWRSRDYRYLGTIGFFDGIYLDLKKGDNELLLAISEDFGGWLVTGKFQNYDSIQLK